MASPWLPAPTCEGWWWAWNPAWPASTSGAVRQPEIRYVLDGQAYEWRVRPLGLLWSGPLTPPPVEPDGARSEE